MPEAAPRSDRSLLTRSGRTLQLVRVLTPRELRVRYRQSVLNVVWVVIAPVAVMITYGVVLSQSFGVTGSCSSYLTSAWAGIAVWTFVATAIGTGVISLVSSADLISKLYFPRESLPLAAVGAALLELTVGGVILFGLAAFDSAANLGLVAWTSILPIMMIIVWTAAITTFLAALAAFTRDIVHGVSIALRVGFFASTVMYEVSDLPKALEWSKYVNPVTVAITAVRDSVLCGVTPHFRVLAVHLVIASALLVGSILYMRSVESRIVDVV